MNLIDYIKGTRKGKDAHRMEKDSMRDPFLYEAIEGFGSVDDNHAARIEDLQRKIRMKSNAQAHRPTVAYKVAAALTGLIALGGYLLVSDNRSNLSAQENGAAVIAIYVPESFYIEHEEIIEEKNEAIAESFNISIRPFSINDNISATISQEEREMLSGGKSTTIDIYIPEEYYEENKASINAKSQIEISNPTIEIYVPAKDYQQHREKIKDIEKRR